MHVSQKIAFRLDDVFYEALDKSEIVALESDPDSWLEDYGKMRSIGLAMEPDLSPKAFISTLLPLKTLPRKSYPPTSPWMIV